MSKRVIKIDEMERMSPDERAAVVSAAITTDLDALPEHFRQIVFTRASELNDERDRLPAA